MSRWSVPPDDRPTRVHIAAVRTYVEPTTSRQPFGQHIKRYTNYADYIHIDHENWLWRRVRPFVRSLVRVAAARHARRFLVRRRH